MAFIKHVFDNLGIGDSDTFVRDRAKFDVLNAHRKEFRKRVATKATPSGDIYRGFSAGYHRCGKKFLLRKGTIMAVCVAFIQVGGPIIMGVSMQLHARYTQFNIVNFYSKLAKDFKSGNGQGKFELSTPAPGIAGEVDETLAGMNVTNGILFCNKFIGILLLLLVFISADNGLRRRASDSVRLRARMRNKIPCISAVWLWIGALVNSLSAVFSCIVAVGLLLTSPSTDKLVLDAFGLLFLMDLAKYGKNIEFDINQDDWAAYLETTYPKAETQELRHQATESEISKASRKGCFHGDIVYTISRVVVVFTALADLPIWLIFVWVPTEICESQGYPVWTLVELGFLSIPASIVAFLLIIVFLTVQHVAVKHAEGEPLSFSTYFQKVILRKKSRDDLVDEPDTDSSSTPIGMSQERQGLLTQR